LNLDQSTRDWWVQFNIKKHGRRTHLWTVALFASRGGFDPELVVERSIIVPEDTFEIDVDITLDRSQVDINVEQRMTHAFSPVVPPSEYGRGLERIGVGDANASVPSSIRPRKEGLARPSASVGARVQFIHDTGTRAVHTIH
tara:strand:- start:11028 stop:11453 length:426 start_codon:yes stop_codon:yes gene_type:complete